MSREISLLNRTKPDSTEVNQSDSGPEVPERTTKHTDGITELMSGTLLCRC